MNDGARRRPIETLAFLAVAWALVLAGNVARGALDSGLGSFDDEPSHVVTGLMVADFVASGEWGDPMGYAKDYYLHYPKVALGQWPPVLYVLIAGWVLVFGASIASFVALTTTFTAGVATLVFGTLREELGAPRAWTFGLLAPALPLVQELGACVMTEVPLALFGFGAVLCFARFVATERRGPLVGFGVLSVAAILTKGSGLGLALAPGLVVALTGRWRVLRRVDTWLVGLAVGALTVPWYAWTLSMAQGTWEGGSSPTLAYLADALPFHLRGTFLAGGVVVGALGVVGLVVRPREDESRTRWAAAVAWIACVLIVHSLVPSSVEARHQVLLLPAWVVLAARGFAILADRLPSARLRVAALAAVPLAFGVQGFELPVRENQGFREAVSAVLADPTLEDSVLLIASDPIGEGLFVGAVALGEERPGHVVLRATKVLASSDWMGRDYELLHADERELEGYLEEVPVGVVAVDRSCPERRLLEHQTRLLALVERRGDVWSPIGTWDVVRDGVRHPDALTLWRQRGHAERPRLELDPDRILGRALPGMTR